MKNFSWSLLAILFTLLVLIHCGSSDNEITGSCTGQSMDFGTKAVKVCVDYFDFEDERSENVKDDCTKAEGSDYLFKWKGSWSEDKCNDEGATAVCLSDENSNNNQSGDLNFYVYDTSANKILKEKVCKSFKQGEFQEIKAPTTIKVSIDYYSSSIQSKENHTHCIGFTNLSSSDVDDVKSTFLEGSSLWQSGETCATENVKHSCTEVESAKGYKMNTYFFQELEEEDKVAQEKRCQELSGTWK